MSNLKVGSIVLFHLDPDRDQPVAYTNDGKSIMCRYIIPPRFAKITEIITENVFSITVDAKSVLCDIFMGMGLNKFLKVVNHFGYRLGLDRCINSQKYGTVQHQLLAYHPKYKTVIVARTDGVNNFPRRCLLNFCEIYIPAGGHTTVHDKQTPVCERIEVLRDPEEAYVRYKMKPLHMVAKMQEDIEKSMESIDDISWKDMLPPKLVLNADRVTSYSRRTPDEITADIIAMAHPDCIKIFEGCTLYDRTTALAKKYEEKGMELWHWDNALTQ